MTMDDDILRRLRAREREYRGTLLERVFADAAAEIARLRAGIDATAEFCAGYELGALAARQSDLKFCVDPTEDMRGLVAQYRQMA